MVQSVLIALLTFSVLVAIHEWGHFWVARRCGVKVLQFAIGFGPALFKWRDKHGTQYRLGALPLGGYVKMLDEGEANVDASERHLAFNNLHPKKRIAIALAGPMANFILAIAAYWFVFVSGVTGLAPVTGSVEPDSPAAIAQLQVGDEFIAVDAYKVESWQTVMRQLMLRLGETGDINVTVLRNGQPVQLHAPINRWLAGDNEPNLMAGFGVKRFEPVVVPVLREVLKDSAAAAAGLQAGDRLVSINAEPIVDWYDWVVKVQAAPNRMLLLGYERDGQSQLTQLTPSVITNDKGRAIGRAGVGVVPPQYPQEYIREFNYAPHIALGKALEQTYTISKFTLESIGKLIRGLISPKNLSGPITIAKVASDSAKYGLESYLNVLALLSISLGVLNLLPVPVLDGGHILYHSIEWLKGSPVSDTIQAISMKIGMTMVLCLMMFAIVNDISRL